MESGTTAHGKTRKRVSEACTFCRRRKIKCDNKRPACGNCTTYHKTCSYEPIEVHSRGQRARTQNPGRARARAPETNDATRNSSQNPTEADGDDHQNSNPPRAAQAHVADERTVSRIVFSDNGASYHGRTSALFEDNSNERAPPKAPRAYLPPEWVQKGLMAEAAKQRQMVSEHHDSDENNHTLDGKRQANEASKEIINYNAGKLDFDGVDPELGMHLLSLHWNRQHHSFLITYRPAFMRDMACNGPYFSKILLNAIYYGASKFSPRLEVRKDPNDVRTAGWTFRQRVRELLGTALDGSEITTIQALLVMTNSLFALGDERSAAWLYAGLAFRMIIDLGMHAEATALTGLRRISEEDLEIRRRVFWGAFVVDKVQSLYQGRPASLQEADTRVPISFLDTYEELEHWTPFAYNEEDRSDYPGGPAYSVSTFTALCGLSVIMNEILNNIYAERTFDRTSEELSKMLETLHSRLETWYETLPSHLRFDPVKTSTAVTPPPHVLSLVAMFNVLLILLHRPFVADGHLYSTARSISVNSLRTCATAATQIVRILRVYHSVFSIRKAPYLISYATYVSATIHVRIAAKRGSGSDAHSSLGTCLDVFRENQETNWAARRANMIVESLIKKLNVTIPENRNTLEPRRQRGRHDPAQPTLIAPPRQLGETLSRPATTDPEGFSPNLDIDAVIQSFLRGQEDPTSGSLNPYPPVNGANSGYANLNMFSGMSNDYFYDNTAAPWHGPDGVTMPPTSKASVDDILFGFNGAAADDFSLPLWP